MIEYKYRVDVVDRMIVSCYYIDVIVNRKGKRMIVNFSRNALVNKIANECFRDLIDLGYRVPIEKSVKIEYNNRLLKAFGRCKSKAVMCGGTFMGYATHTIDLNTVLQNCSNEFLKNVIMHELIHTIAPKDGHRGLFLTIMYRVNNSKGYNVEIKGTDKQAREEKKKQYKYEVVCKKCGTLIGYRHRKPSQPMIHSRDKGEVEFRKIA